MRPHVAFPHSQGHRLDNGVFLLAFNDLIPSQNSDDGIVPIALADETAIDAGVLGIRYRLPSLFSNLVKCITLDPLSSEACLNTAALPNCRELSKRIDGLAPSRRYNGMRPRGASAAMGRYAQSERLFGMFSIRSG